MTLLQDGSSGDEVTRLQQALVDAGYFVGAVDGHFGPKTTAAVGYLQSTHGLDIDGIAGEQVREILDIGGALSVFIHAEWPDIDIWNPGDEFVVPVESMEGTHNPDQVRVVVWFRGPAGEEYTEETISLSAGSTTMARLELPSDTASTEGEVHWTGYVFDMSGSDALTDEGSGSFRVDRPDAIE